MAQQPSVSRLVHYVSHGSPVREDGTQAYPSVCRAAVVTAVPDPDEDGTAFASLCVLNPTGMLFGQFVVFDEGDPFEVGDPRPALCNGLAYAGGTWHWPERA